MRNARQKGANMPDLTIVTVESQPIGPSWERYMNDPSSTPEAELVTEVYFPVD